MIRQQKQPVSSGRQLTKIGIQMDKDMILNNTVKTEDQRLGTRHEASRTDTANRASRSKKGKQLMRQARTAEAMSR